MNEDEANESPEMVATSGIKWPDIPRLVFAPGPDPHANVRLDWVFTGHDDARFAYAEGYREAIEAIHEKAVARGIVIEHAIFPLAFLWRHRLELHLKDALRDAKSLWCEEYRPPNHHDLLKLWLELKPYAVDLGTPGTPEIENVEANIVE